MHRSLVPAIILLVALLILFENTAIDVWVQDHFFDFQTGAWLVKKQQTLPRFVFYSGIKFAIFTFGTVLMVLCLLPSRLREKLIGSNFCRRDLWVVVATLVTAPSLVALSKATTNVHCPYQLNRYGGDYPYFKLLEQAPPDLLQKGRGRGFPAGHASGGFALLSLAGLGRTRRGALAGMAVGLLAGGSMGTYQMLNGAHFLSHTLITAIFCWIVFLLWRRVLHDGFSGAR
jgi:membrane-associated PAP2 superfamily phosphatase